MALISDYNVSLSTQSRTRNPRGCCSIIGFGMQVCLIMKWGLWWWSKLNELTLVTFFSFLFFVPCLVVVTLHKYSKAYIIKKMSLLSFFWLSSIRYKWRWKQLQMPTLQWIALSSLLFQAKTGYGSNKTCHFYLAQISLALHCITGDVLYVLSDY